VLKENFPSLLPQHPYDCNISPYYRQFVPVTKPVTEFYKTDATKRKIKK
jgi:hypothetical protein